MREVVRVFGSKHDGVYYLLCEGLGLCVSPLMMKKTLEQLKERSFLSVSIDGCIPWIVLNPVFKDTKYLGRLSEELVEDILFMEELGK